MRLLCMGERYAKMTIKVHDVIEYLVRAVETIDNTVDGLNAGVSSMEVSGIAVTFMASQQAIEKAIAQGANLLITHEGEYFSHRGGREQWQDDPIVMGKSCLIEQSGIAIYRFHDYWHAYRPDGITEGLTQLLGWSEYVKEVLPYASIIELPAECSLDEIAYAAKDKLGLSYVRVVGEASATCRRIGLSAGYRGGGAVCIPLFHQYDLDLIISGEGQEWETPEYVRDAMHHGANKAFLLLGHAESEEPGMHYLASILEREFHQVPVSFVKQTPLFRIV